MQRWGKKGEKGKKDAGVAEMCAMAAHFFWMVVENADICGAKTAGFVNNETENNNRNETRKNHK